MDSGDKSFAIVLVTLVVVIFGGLFSGAYLEGERKLKCVALVANKPATEIMAVCK